jgi:hypothetical protein
MKISRTDMSVRIFVLDEKEYIIQDVQPFGDGSRGFAKASRVPLPRDEPKD